MIGQVLKRIRESKNIGVNELSRLSGVNASYISALERDEKKNPSTKILEKLANVLGISVNDFYKDGVIKDDKEDPQSEVDFLNKLTEENRLLFKKVKSLSPEDAKKILNIIEIFEKENGQ